MNELNFLIVDDDDLLRLTIKNTLLSLDCTNSVTESASGFQALEILQQKGAPAIEIVLCNLQMPEMDAAEFIRNLGQVRANISLILISSNDFAQMGDVMKVAAACNVRLLGVAQKPVSREYIEALARKHKPARPA